METAPTERARVHGSDWQLDGALRLAGRTSATKLLLARLPKSVVRRSHPQRRRAEERPLIKLAPLSGEGKPGGRIASHSRRWPRLGFC